MALTCDMEKDCPEPVTYIDNHGFVYCAKHGRERKYNMPCRKLRPYELNRLRKDQTIRYERS